MSLRKRLKYFRISNIQYIFHHHYWVNEDLRVPASRHYFPSTFGVRQRHDARTAEYGEYICTGMPGTGFFVHATDSHSYHNFVRQMRDDSKPSFSNMLHGKEPNYSREIKTVTKALASESDAGRKHVLDNYANCLAIGQQAEMLQRLHAGVKNKVGQHLGKGAVSIITHLKSQIATLQHDMQSAEINPLEALNEEQRQQWQTLTDAFRNFMTSRRLFSIEKNAKSGETEYNQVFADMGIFNFIWMSTDTPLLRDAKGNTYYFYPKGIIKAKSNVDFEVCFDDKLTVEYHPVDVSSLLPNTSININSLKHHKNANDLVSELYGVSKHGQMAYLTIPKMGLTLLCSKLEYAKRLADAMTAMLQSMHDKQK